MKTRRPRPLDDGDMASVWAETSIAPQAENPPRKVDFLSEHRPCALEGRRGVGVLFTCQRL